MLLNQLLAQLQGGQQNQASDWQQRMLQQMSGGPISPSPIGYGSAVSPSPAPSPITPSQARLGGPNPASAATQGPSAPTARREAPQLPGASASTYLTGALQGAAQGRNPLSMLIGGLAGAAGAGQQVDRQNQTYGALTQSGAFTPQEAQLAIQNPAAFELIAQRKQEAQKQAQAEAQKNATVGFLMKRHGLTADEAAAIASNPAALVPYLKPAGGPGGSTEYGKTVQYAQDEKGNIRPFVTGSDGSVKYLDLGQGSQALGPEGTAAARARGNLTGKTLAEAKAALPKVIETSGTMMTNLDRLEADPYLNSMLGNVEGRMYNVTSDAERVQARMDQITGGAFLQAFQMLRGGGQITEIEGKKATAAITRLENVKQDEAAYRAAIEDLKTLVRNSVIRARVEAGELPIEALGQLFDVEKFKLPSEIYDERKKGGQAPAALNPAARGPRGQPIAGGAQPDADGFVIERE